MGIQLKTITEALRGYEPRHLGRIFLLDRQEHGFRVNSGETDPVLEDWHGSPLTGLGQSGHDARLVTVNGQQRIVSWGAIPALGMTIGIEAASADVLAGGRYVVVRGILIAGLLAVALSVGTAFVGGRLAQGQLDTLRHYLRRLADAPGMNLPAMPRLRIRELERIGQNARAMAETIKVRQEELEVLFALDRALAQGNRVEDIVRLAVEHVLPLLGFAAAAAFLLDPRGKTLRLIHARELPPAVEAGIATIPVGAGAAGRAVSERRALVVPVQAYPGELIPRGAVAIREAGFQSIASTPMVAHGVAFGALSLLSRQPVPSTDSMLALLTSVGTQLGLAVSHAVDRERVIVHERLAALGRLAAGVAHELRNPMMVVSGRMHLLRTQLEATGSLQRERALSHLSRLGDAVERMHRIVEGLSTYGKPPKAEPQWLEVGPLLAAIHELVAYAARKAGVTVAAEVGPDLPPVRADRSQLMQILLNLATNAIEAMGEAGGQLVLRARVDDDHRENAARSVIVEVSDTGPGIPPDALETIWEPFYTTKPEGTGLGLSIVRSLVAEQPGAGITVHSEPGQGTTFRLTMPPAPPSGHPMP
jgi:signal transduction histidine kinase